MVPRGKLSILAGSARIVFKRRMTQETEVESRVARVRTLKIEQDQSSHVHQNVLRAEVPQDEGPLA